MITSARTPITTAALRHRIEAKYIIVEAKSKLLEKLQQTATSAVQKALLALFTSGVLTTPAHGEIEDPKKWADKMEEVAEDQVDLDLKIIPWVIKEGSKTSPQIVKWNIKDTDSDEFAIIEYTEGHGARFIFKREDEGQLAKTWRLSGRNPSEREASDFEVFVRDMTKTLSNLALSEERKGRMYKQPPE